ncbi:hypothetical protein APA_3943 [Pseudanabaena sp. lw0831]|nr:hypothetical protein APA_3943 [Pseudanabaena sp. lw0831]
MELRRQQDGEMRFYDPATDQKLRSTAEFAAAKLEAERAKSLAEQGQFTAEQAKFAAEQRASKLADKLCELGIDPENL